MNRTELNSIAKRLPVKFIFAVVLLSGLISLQSCSYSFTGASVPSHLKTISIPIFIDRSGSGEFDLNTRLSNKLIQKFLEDNTLLLSDRTKSDSILEGTIVTLSDAAAVVAGGEKVSSRRITITVRTVYKDLVKKVTVFDKNFSNYGDYVTGGDITAVRKQAIDSAIDKITEDILLGVVSNW